MTSQEIIATIIEDLSVAELRKAYQQLRSSETGDSEMYDYYVGMCTAYERLLDGMGFVLDFVPVTREYASEELTYSSCQIMGRLSSN